MPRRNLYAITAVVALSLICRQATQGAKSKDDTLELYGLFVDAVEQVQANYVRPVERKKLLESALRGMLSDLDPHSAFIDTTQWKAFRKKIDGRFGGLGITVGLDQRSNRLRVVAPMVGTPAYDAGIVAGDIILDIDGISTEGMTADKAVEVLQGRPGTPVKLRVAHEGISKPEVITLHRAIIQVPSVLGDARKADDRPDFMLDKDKKIGYVRITDFIQSTAQDVAAALRELEAGGVKGLILDLRDDPGGLLSAAVEISDMFVPKGQIVSTKGRNQADKVYESQDDGSIFEKIPMVVLVNDHSASASEIVAAALQDHGRALVVGQRSFGKGSVQNILDLEDGNSVLKLTVATYWRPSGKNIHRFPNAKESEEWGVSPDKGLEVKLTPQQHLQWALARRDRDLLINSSKRPKTDAERRAKDEAKPADASKPKDDAKPKDDPPSKEEPKAKDEAKSKDESKPKEEPKAKTEPSVRSGSADREWKDIQLEKAVEVLSEKLKTA
ncbi:MAG: S41 family peptidase [Isosphaeraceae bacterium]|nr:S41 family peptidase [Isosphaeraceae bacterium]